MDNLKLTTDGNVSFEISRFDKDARFSPVMIIITDENDSLGYRLTQQEARLLSIFLERIIQ